MPPSSSSPSSSSSDDPEYIAIILAATEGARLFPLTSEFPSGVPKHLLPLLPLRPSVDDGSIARGGTVGGNSSGKEGEGESRIKDSEKPSGDADGTATSDSNDGHVGGCPLLERLLHKCHDTGLEMAVVAIHQEDCMTVPFLLTGSLDGSGKGGICRRLLGKEQVNYSCQWYPTSAGDAIVDMIYPSLQGGGKGAAPRKQTPVNSSKKGMHVRVVRLPTECHGSADALRYLSRPPAGGGKKANDTEGLRKSVDGGDKENNNNNNKSLSENTETLGNANGRGRIIPATSNAIVIPGDLITEGQLLSGSGDERDVFSLLVEAHRRWNVGGQVGENGTMGGGSMVGSELNSGNAACTMLLTDVGAEDKNGVPLTKGSRVSFENENVLDFIFCFFVSLRLS